MMMISSTFFMMYNFMSFEKYQKKSYYKQKSTTTKL